MENGNKFFCLFYLICFQRVKKGIMFLPHYMTPLL